VAPSGSTCRPNKLFLLVGKPCRFWCAKNTSVARGLIRHEYFFQDVKKAGISRLLKEKGRDGAVLAKKGQFASYKEKLEKLTEFHYFF
jgi:hypothetical protein